MSINCLKKGNLLIANPSIIGDDIFSRTVILLTEHTKKQGSIGFIINKPLENTLDTLIKGVNKTFPVFYGGPVEQDNLYFIHSIPQIIPNSIEIAQGIYWGGDFKTIHSLINTGSILDTDIKFFLGYSGWEKEQLHQEIEQGVWIKQENNLKNTLLQKTHNYHLWKDKMIELGGVYSIWSNAPENPDYN